MNQPEYTLADSEKIHHMVNQQDNFDQVLKDLEVDSAVLYRELTKLEGFSGRIAEDIRALVSLVVERELSD